MWYLIVGSAIAVIIAIITVFSLFKKNKQEIKRLDKALKGSKNENAALSKSNAILSDQLKEAQDAIEKLSKGNREANGTYSGKQVAMYREATPTEKAGQNIDYKYLQQFASMRQAASMTGTRRQLISDSVKTGKSVKHGKNKIMVIFAPVNNDLNSDEKKIGK